MPLVAKPAYQEVTDARRALHPPPRIDEAALAAFGCDVSFISDDSTPAEELVARAVEQATTREVKQLLREIFDRIRGDYDQNGAIVHPAAVATRIRQAASALGLEPSAEQRGLLLRLFNDVNQVLFQHETLSWLAGDATFKIHLYGNGWDQHPLLARHARGAIRDERMARTIFRASKINLATAAYGAMTPHVLEGIGDGGFFLMRFCAADVIERFYPPLLDFCARERIRSNEELSERATPGVRALLAFASRTMGVDVLRDWPDFVPNLRSSSAQGRSHCAAVLWPDEYPAVCFSSRDELLNLVAKFLYDAPERRELAERMRRQLASPAPSSISVQVHRAAIAPRRRNEVAA